jgi:hypothetical protein
MVAEGSWAQDALEPAGTLMVGRDLLFGWGEPAREEGPLWPTRREADELSVSAVDAVDVDILRWKKSGSSASDIGMGLRAIGKSGSVLTDDIGGTTRKKKKKKIMMREKLGGREE